MRKSRPPGQAELACRLDRELSLGRHVILLAGQGDDQEIQVIRRLSMATGQSLYPHMNEFSLI